MFNKLAVVDIDIDQKYKITNAKAKQSYNETGRLVQEKNALK